MKKLHILWTTDNKDTVTHMLGMYAINSKLQGWWDEVNIIIWGASQKLVASDAEVQELVAEMMEQGVTVEACKGCSDSFCLSDNLRGQGIDVVYTGEKLTAYIQSDAELLSL